MSSKAEIYMNQPPERKKSKDPYIAKLEEKLPLVELDPDITFEGLEFAPYKDYLRRKERNFDGVSTYELQEMVLALAKDCLVMKLKNEIYENYLKRQNPFFEIEKEEPKTELTEEEIEKEKLLKELENSELKITSKELLWRDEEVKKLGNKDHVLLSEKEEQHIDFLVTVVEKEIGELYRTAKKKGIEHDKKYAEIQAQQKSLEEEIDNLEEGLRVFQSMFGQLFTTKQKRAQQKVDPNKVAQYFQHETKRLDKKARKIGVQSALVGKELKRMEHWRTNSSTVTPGDLEVLQVECEQLQEQLDRNQHEFFKLRTTLDKLNRKVDKETELAREREDHLKKINKNMDKMKKKVLDIKTNRELAERELKSFEKQRKKLMEEECKFEETSAQNQEKSSTNHDWNLKKARSRFHISKNIVDNFGTF
ncbi:uncharacterized protein [Rhodnius prolixus]|uniref:uncharacterized protein n=1 Tax=Rhodnius prolixus TaxID=13249 RepID=UPI003D18CBB5